MTRSLLLVRHGVTTWNREGRFQGHLDPPLADDGHVEVALLAERISADAGLRPARIVSSPLLRATQTADALTHALGDLADAARDVRLQEIGQGDWEGMTHAELARDDAARYAAWRANAGHQQPPGAETIEEASSRIAAALDELLAAGPWPLCLVSHGGTLRLVVRILLDVDGRQAWALDLDNASLSVLEREDDATRWRLVRWNDTGHLLGRAELHVDESEGAPLAL